MRLPSFLIIGGQRSGTTSIHYSLMEHPNIYMSRRKEVDFFLRAADGNLPAWMDRDDARRVPRTLAEYAALFDEAGSAQAVGESSPSYLSGAVAPRIAAALPQVKLIAILRHPVDQARSILGTWLGRTPTPEELSEWLAAQNRCGPRGTPPLVTHGRYVHHLMPYFRHFDRRQIKVVLFEDLTARPQDVLREIQEFLEVEPIDLPLLHLNAHGQPRSQLVAAALGARAKRIARAVIPMRLLRRLVPHLHRVQSANTLVSPPLAPDMRQRLFEQHYLSATLQLALMLRRGTLRPWLGAEEYNGRIVA